ncbi:MAG: hypothetical protein AB7P14_22915 [Blastocatellales bacterium]
MSTISFTFEDLCAFFTKYPSRLMVGLIPTDNEAPEDIHRPHIIIKENGVVKKEYHEFSEINGDISLDVYPKADPLTYHVPRSSRDSRHSFDTVVDLEKQLYPGTTLNADAKRCRARLHFNSGTVYTSAHAINAVFADSKTHSPQDNAPTTVATKAGLDVTVPKDGYAVLHFHGDTEDFVFKGGRNYQVEVVNRAEAIDFNHFRYFYNIVTPKPKNKIIPISAQGVGANLRLGDWACIVGAFGNSDYLLPGSKKR